MLMKHKHVLREFSKFASGLVFADLLSVIWLWTSDMLPIDFLGMTFTDQHAGVAIVFDIVLFGFFVYYGWHQQKYSHRSKEYIFHYVLGLLLATVSIAHLSRLVLGHDMTFGDWSIPLWLSAVGALLTGVLSYTSFVLAKK